MSAFVLRLEWSGPENLEDEASRPLDGADLEYAKFEAAMIYAVTDFKGGPPTGYCILDTAQDEVFRYPMGLREVN